MAPHELLRVGLRQLLGKKFVKRRTSDGPFQQSSSPVRVAVVGGGMAGLMTAYTLHRSNLARASCGGDPSCVAPAFNVTLFEASPRVGGHSWTVRFPLADGGTYPVDVGYAYNPTMASYGIIRNFERLHGLHMAGPLQQCASPGLSPPAASRAHCPLTARSRLHAPSQARRRLPARI